MVINSCAVSVSLWKSITTFTVLRILMFHLVIFWVEMHGVFKNKHKNTFQWFFLLLLLLFMMLIQIEGEKWFCTFIAWMLSLWCLHGRLLWFFMQCRVGFEWRWLVATVDSDPWCTFTNFGDDAVCKVKSHNYVIVIVDMNGAATCLSSVDSCHTKFQRLKQLNW